MKSLLPPSPLLRRNIQLQRRGRIVIDPVPPTTTTVKQQLHSISTSATTPSRSTIAISFQRRRLRRLLPAPPHTQTQIIQAKRSFHIPQLSSFFPSSSSSSSNNNGSNGNSDDGRTLRATRTLPFPPAPLFDVIASVESYADFLPFLTASTVTARDPATGYPTQAFLTVGYGPFSETFTSRVDCDRDRWVVEARSGGGVAEDGKPVPGADEGLFNYLSTRWELIPIKEGEQHKETRVQLEIRFRFQNPLHTAMMSAVEDKVAGVMIEAFERRIRERMLSNRY
ncbi:hypothetical protein VTN96DRAFT_5617 [Rasamsonia emersonii]|uniref:Cyclase/dehydrase family protein n=1 Tax=Rasamsonia emersonii (strain ATCC 16479 / CBS 393.64 / IMI 116815) TaxID=1408163 RepID=A0A0F4YFN1_RASE3|nr:cyclase/dehydrase family protein [Rasamsonia emersonii CBS 393.64]KKA16731.1 cyclase/dehydrase family protein [Rasamsonia emersonii CBS 393.64]